MKGLYNMQLHPNYADQDTDVIIVSNDGLEFRVHSVILQKGAKGLYDNIDTRHRHSSPGGPQQDLVVSFEDSAEILANLLNIISPDIYVPLHLASVDQAIHLYQTAKKYDVKKALLVIRERTMEDVNLRQVPLKMYVMACRLGWDAEVKTISSWTLDIDVHSRQSLDVLKGLSRVEDLVNLQLLHRIRQETFKRLWKNINDQQIIRSVPSHTLPVNSPPHDWMYMPGNPGYTWPSHSQAHHAGLNTNGTINNWRERFDSKILAAFQRRPSGAELLSPEFLDKEDITEIFSNTPSPQMIMLRRASVWQQHGAPGSMDKEGTISAIKFVLESLPQSIGSIADGDSIYANTDAEGSSYATPS